MAQVDDLPRSVVRRILKRAIQAMKSRTPQERLRAARGMLRDPEYRNQYGDVLRADIERYVAEIEEAER